MIFMLLHHFTFRLPLELFSNYHLFSSLLNMFCLRRRFRTASTTLLKRMNWVNYHIMFFFAQCPSVRKHFKPVGAFYTNCPEIRFLQRKCMLGTGSVIINQFSVSLGFFVFFWNIWLIKPQMAVRPSHLDVNVQHSVCIPEETDYPQIQ